MASKWRQEREMWLVRHARTDFNVPGPAGRFCGRSDPPLNSAGETEARQLSTRLSAAAKQMQVVSSPLRRAGATAEAICRSAGSSFHVDDRLAEIDYGHWEGLTKHEVVRRHPQEHQRFTAAPSAFAPSGGEHPLDALERFQDAVERWMRAGDCVIVSHKTVMRLFLAKYGFAAHLDEYRSISFGISALAHFKVTLTGGEIVEVHLMDDGHKSEYEIIGA